MEAAIGALHYNAQEKGLELESEMEAELPVFEGDERRITGSFRRCR